MRKTYFFVFSGLVAGYILLFGPIYFLVLFINRHYGFSAVTQQAILPLLWPHFYLMYISEDYCTYGMWWRSLETGEDNSYSRFRRSYDNTK